MSVAGLGSARHRLVAESPAGPAAGGWGQGWEHELDLPENIGEHFGEAYGVYHFTSL